jgi:hypothetical protein
MFEGIWEGFDSKDDIASAYQIHISDLDDAEVLIAKYHTGSYEGSSFVLIQRGKVLYEVNASHCSCYGLEGQWDEEETFLDALKKRNDQFVSQAEMMLVEAHLSKGKSMEPVYIRIVDDGTGSQYALKNGTPAKYYTVPLFESAEQRRAYLDAQDEKKLKESALAKLTAAERKALGL